MAGPFPHSWESVYVRCHVGCGTLAGDGLTKYIQNDANEWETQSLEKNYWFEIKNNNEDRDKSIPKSTGTLTVLRCIFGPNLEILTSIIGNLSRGQTHQLKMGWILTLNWNLTLKVKVNHPQKYSGSQPRSFTPMVKIWWFELERKRSYRADKLGEGRTDGLTDGRTDAGNDNTRGPKLASGKNEIHFGIKIWKDNWILLKNWSKI